MFGQARGIERRQHRKRGFGNAVVAPVDRRGVRADGRDKDDLWMEWIRGGGAGKTAVDWSRKLASDHRINALTGAAAFLDLIDHPPRGKLSQEIGPLHIDADQPVKTFFGGFENIGAKVWRDPGVVDEQVQPAKSLLREIDQPPPVWRQAHIRLTGFGMNGSAARLRD